MKLLWRARYPRYPLCSLPHDTCEWLAIISIDRTVRLLFTIAVPVVIEDMALSDVSGVPRLEPDRFFLSFSFSFSYSSCYFLIFPFHLHTQNSVDMICFIPPLCGSDTSWRSSTHAYIRRFSFLFFLLYLWNIVCILPQAASWPDACHTNICRRFKEGICIGWLFDIWIYGVFLFFLSLSFPQILGYIWLNHFPFFANPYVHTFLFTHSLIQTYQLNSLPFTYQTTPLPPPPPPCRTYSCIA